MDMRPHSEKWESQTGKIDVQFGGLGSNGHKVDLPNPNRGRYTGFKAGSSLTIMMAPR